MKNRILTTALIIFIISVTFGGAMFGLNFITGPMIEANNAGAEFAPLLAVMPEGAEFDGDALIYDSENASASTLKNVPAAVLSVYKEKNALGFAIRTTATTKYTDSPLVMTIGVTAEGNICGIQIDDFGAGSSNWNSKYLTKEYVGNYIGKDSALAGVELIGGVTYSSQAFKDAVEEALGALIANDLITAGVKSDAQILEELIPTVAPGFVKLTEVSASGNIQKALKAGNDAGFAYIMTEGEASYLALVNVAGVCKIYDVEGVDVTADHENLVTEAVAHAAANQKSYVDTLTTKVGKMMEGASDFEALDITTYNTVISAVSFQLDGATYYAFYAVGYSYDQNKMNVYIILDSEGKIAKVDASQFVFEEEYFYGFNGVPNGYKDGFVGESIDSWTGDKAIIAGATLSTTVMKTATADAFAAFESIKGGEQ